MAGEITEVYSDDMGLRSRKPDYDKVAVLASRTRELMTERRMSWDEGWQAAEQEWYVANGLPPTTTHRKQGSKWLNLTARGVQVGAVVTLGALGFAIAQGLCGQNDTCTEGSEEFFFMLLWVAAAGFALTVIASLGYAGVWIYRRLRPAKSPNLSD
jgi:hypothetical protein